MKNEVMLSSTPAQREPGLIRTIGITVIQAPTPVRRSMTQKLIDDAKLEFSRFASLAQDMLA
jgi:hypothetical protein